MRSIRSCSRPEGYASTMCAYTAAATSSGVSNVTSSRESGKNSQNSGSSSAMPHATISAPIRTLPRRAQMRSPAATVTT